MAMATMPDVGDRAPGFVLKDHNQKDVALGDFAGKKVVLSFHPLAWTRVCALQMQDLEKKKTAFDSSGAIAFGLSIDSAPCKRAWAESLGVKDTSLLADFWPHGGVARSYGIFREKDGFSERAVIIVDGHGIIRFKKVYPISELPDIEVIVKEVESL